MLKRVKQQMTSMKMNEMNEMNEINEMNEDVFLRVAFDVDAEEEEDVA